MSGFPKHGGEGRWLHRLALLTACATFPLLLIGGLVTSKGAGLAVPDWPTTFGYNMFFFPWGKMVGNIFYEHAHRLVASGVGLLTVALAISLWIYEPRKWLRILGGMALVLVIIQGVVGGLRVVLLDGTLAILHACLAQGFFALTVGLVLFTSAEWEGEPSKATTPDAGRVLRLGLLTTSLIFVQAVSGAVVRHTGTGFEVHFVLAVLVALHVVLLSMRILRVPSSASNLRRPAALLIALLIGQLALGFASYLAKFSLLTGLSSMVVALTTSHVAVSALLLATGLILTLRAHRLPVASQPIPNAASFSRVAMS